MRCRRLLSTVAGLGLVLALAGCGPEDPPAADGGGDQGQPAAAPPASTSAPSKTPLWQLEGGVPPQVSAEEAFPGADPAEVAAHSEDPTPISKGMTFGSPYSSVTYDDLWEANLPQTLWVDPSRPVGVTAWFTSAPSFWPNGDVRDDEGTVDYRWGIVCSYHAPMWLTPVQQATITVPPGVTLTNAGTFPDALRIDAELSIPQTCEDPKRFVIQFRGTWSPGTPGSMSSPYLGFLPAPFGTPGSDVLEGTDPVITVWAVLNRRELAEVKRSGSLDAFSSNGFRYLFTECAAVQDLVAWAVGPSDPRTFGIARFSVPRDAFAAKAGDLTGTLATAQGERPLTVFLAKNGVEKTFGDPTLVDLAGDAAGCA